MDGCLVWFPSISQSQRFGENHPIDSQPFLDGCCLGFQVVNLPPPRNSLPSDQGFVNPFGFPLIRPAIKPLFFRGVSYEGGVGWRAIRRPIEDFSVCKKMEEHQKLTKNKVNVSWTEFLKNEDWRNFVPFSNNYGSEENGPLWRTVYSSSRASCCSGSHDYGK